MELVSIWPLIEDQLRMLCAGLLNVSIDRGDLSELLREVTRCRPTGNAKDLAHQLHQARNEFAHRKGTDLPETVWLSMFSAAARFADEFPNHPSSEQIRSLYAQAKPILSRLLTIPTQKTIHSDDLVRWTKNQGFLNRYDKRIARKWIIDQVVSAIEREDSHLVVIHGAPGVGKSTIAAEWIETHQTTCAYHINEYDNEDSKSIDALVSALVGSLLDTNPEFQPGVTYRDIVGGSDSSVPGWNSLSITARWNRFIVEPLTKWNLARNGCFTLLVDALDETSQQQIDFLIKHHADLPYTAKIIVTSRPEIKVPKAAVVIGIDDPMQNNDIRSYVALNLPNTNLSRYEWNSIVDEITSQANGVFVAAKLLIDAYNGEGYAPSAPHALNNLFVEWFGRAVPVEHRTLTSQLLRILCLAYASIPTTVLRSALNISERELREHLSRLGSLVDVQDNRVRLFHKLLADWILDPDTLIIDGSMESAKSRLAEVMLDDASDYAARYAIRHLLSAGHGDLAGEKLTDFRCLQWRVTKGCARDCYSDLCLVHTDLRSLIFSDWLETFRQNCEHWTSFPELFHQDCRNCPDFSDPCVKAYKEPITGSWVMELNKPQAWKRTKGIDFDCSVVGVTLIESINVIGVAFADSVCLFDIDTLRHRKTEYLPKLSGESDGLVAITNNGNDSGFLMLTNQGALLEYDIGDKEYTVLGEVGFEIAAAYFSFEYTKAVCLSPDGSFRLVDTNTLKSIIFDCTEKHELPDYVQWSRNNDRVIVAYGTSNGFELTCMSTLGDRCSMFVEGSIEFQPDCFGTVIVRDGTNRILLDVVSNTIHAVTEERRRFLVNRIVGFNRFRTESSDELLSRIKAEFSARLNRLRSASCSSVSFFATSDGTRLQVSNINTDASIHLFGHNTSLSGWIGHRFLTEICDVDEQNLLQYKFEMRLFAPDHHCLVLVSRPNAQNRDLAHDNVIVLIRTDDTLQKFFEFDIPTGFWVTDVLALDNEHLSIEYLDSEGSVYTTLIVNFHDKSTRSHVGLAGVGSTTKGIIGRSEIGWHIWDHIYQVAVSGDSIVMEVFPSFCLYDGSIVPVCNFDCESVNYHDRVQSTISDLLDVKFSIQSSASRMLLIENERLNCTWKLKCSDNLTPEGLTFYPMRPSRLTYSREGESITCELMLGEEPYPLW